MKKSVYMIFLLFHCDALSEEIDFNEEFCEYRWVTEEETGNLDLNVETRSTLKQIGFCRTSGGEIANMKETTLADTPDAKSPAGADIRFIMDGTTGNMIHSTVKPGQINKATVHATVSEFWHILEGYGEIWRKDATQEKITVLETDTSIDIPCGTAFQYKNTGDIDLKFICIAMPPWPGDDEATYVSGIWEATV